LGKGSAVAKDIAFAFSYVHHAGITGGAWGRRFRSSRRSPTKRRRSDADAIYLPGGYPELHAGKLSEAQTFLSGVQAAAENGALIYGECGGYMILGDGLVDADGRRHKMLGLSAAGNVVPNPQSAPRLSEGHLKNRCAMARGAGGSRVSLCQCCE
jgi:cobyrinic acid a,c-diamide synthase